jgi:hypothetical protein
MLASALAKAAAQLGPRGHLFCQILHSARTVRHRNSSTVSRQQTGSWANQKVGQMIDPDLMLCADCGFDTTTHEYYMVRNDVWAQACPLDQHDVFLCIGCLENRIGRTLTRWDFIDCPLNAHPDWPRSERLRNRLGRGGMIDLALAFARAGFAVFPVNVFRRGDRWRKVPHVVDWENAATTDPEVIGEWWVRWRTAKPGLPLSRCGLVVVDADRHPGAPDGIEAFHALGKLPRHPITKTRGGGEHHWFRQPPTPITKKQSWRPGIDLIGASGFVVGYEVPDGQIPVLPEVFWPKLPLQYVPQRCVQGVGLGDVLVTDLTSALRKMDACDWRGQFDRWFELLMACKYVGISERNWVEWCLSDPHYANDADEIAHIWRSVVPKHGGAFYAALKVRGIRTHTQHYPHTHSEVPTAPADWRSRFEGAREWLRRHPTEPDLFSAACLIAEIAPRTPTAKVKELLLQDCAANGLTKLLGVDGCRKTIERGFAHIERKAN